MGCSTRKRSSKPGPDAWKTSWASIWNSVSKLRKNSTQTNFSNNPSTSRKKPLKTPPKANSRWSRSKRRWKYPVKYNLPLRRRWRRSRRMNPKKLLMLPNRQLKWRRHSCQRGSRCRAPTLIQRCHLCCGAPCVSIRLLELIGSSPCTTSAWMAFSPTKWASARPSKPSLC